jgi:hypothetical protein
MVRTLDPAEYSEQLLFVREALAYISSTNAKDGTGLLAWREQMWDRDIAARDTAVDDLIDHHWDMPALDGYRATLFPIDSSDERNWPEMDRRMRMRLEVARTFEQPEDLVAELAYRLASATPEGAGALEEEESV